MVAGGGPGLSGRRGAALCLGAQLMERAEKWRGLAASPRTSPGGCCGGGGHFWASASSMWRPRPVPLLCVNMCVRMMGMDECSPPSIPAAGHP